MKRSVLKSCMCLLMFMASVLVYANDIIITKDAKKIDAKILEVYKDEIRYKEPDNIDGPVFIMNIADINSIIYQNGKVVLYNEKEQDHGKSDSVEIKEDSDTVDQTAELYDSETQELINSVNGIPQGVVALKGNCSVLYNEQSRVFFDFDFEDAKLVEYDELLSECKYRGDFSKYLEKEMLNIDKSDVIYKACLENAKKMIKNRCMFIPIQRYDPLKDNDWNDYIMRLHIKFIDMGYAPNVFSTGTSTVGGAVMFGSAEIIRATTKEVIATFVVDRIQGMESSLPMKRFQYLINEFLTNKAYKVKKSDSYTNESSSDNSSSSGMYYDEKEWKTRGFEPQLRISVDEGVDLQRNFSFGFDLTAAYRCNENFRIGAGVGINYVNLKFEDPKVIRGTLFNAYYEAAMAIPIFANIKVDFLKRKASPYLSSDIGYNIFIPFSQYAQDNRLGFFVRPAFGVDIRFRKATLSIELAYKFQMRQFHNELADYGNYNQISQAIAVSF